MMTRSNADPLPTRDALEKAARLYAGAQDLNDLQVSPLYGDLTASPPVLLHVGEDEVLLDDSRRFAEGLEATGSSAHLHVWQGMVHVFPSNVELLQAAGEALDDIGKSYALTL